MADDEALRHAVSEALAPVAGMVTDLHKDEKSIHGYFKKAAKTINFIKKPWCELIDEYADAALGALFQGIGDRPWLTKVDFLFVLDAGVKETFPKKVLAEVSQEDLERAVLAAHDRSFDEQRYLCKLWEATQAFVASAGPKAKKKVIEAATAGHQAAMAKCNLEGDASEMKAFVHEWVEVTLSHLARLTQNDLSSAFTEEVCVKMFEALIDDGSLPTPFQVAHGSPNRSFVAHAVQMAYRQHAGEGDSTAASLPSKLPQGNTKGWPKSFSIFGSQATGAAQPSTQQQAAHGDIAPPFRWGMPAEPRDNLMRSLKMMGSSIAEANQPGGGHHWQPEANQPGGGHHWQPEAKRWKGGGWWAS